MLLPMGTRRGCLVRCVLSQAMFLVMLVPAPLAQIGLVKTSASGDPNCPCVGGDSAFNLTKSEDVTLTAIAGYNPTLYTRPSDYGTACSRWDEGLQHVDCNVYMTLSQALCRRCAGAVPGRCAGAVQSLHSRCTATAQPMRMSIHMSIHMSMRRSIPILRKRRPGHT